MIGYPERRFFSLRAFNRRQEQFPGGGGAFQSHAGGRCTFFQFAAA